MAASTLHKNGPPKTRGPFSRNYLSINALTATYGGKRWAREIMSRFESTHKQTIDNQSIIHYWMAKAYRAEGNKDKALEEFATSARLDFIGPYKASRSLVQAAILLLEKGDIVRSYNYITRNYRDAIDADARICLDEISDFMPLVVSVLALIIVRRLQTRISRANQEILQALRSDDFIDQEREILYEEFDRTFLGVFPDFVEQLNSLLEPDKRIGENLPEGKLTNELRIFALIRLGVNESGKIAQFLRKSPSTIYNYRVKLRNCSVCGGEEFEKRLMEIGQN